MEQKIILTLQDVRINYGPITAIKGVNMNVERGKICAILGANGAGKSTIIKAVGGLIKPSAGDISFNGVSTKKLRPNKIANLGIITSPEGRLIMGDLTVEENLMVGTYSLKKGSLICTTK